MGQVLGTRAYMLVYSASRSRIRSMMDLPCPDLSDSEAHLSDEDSTPPSRTRGPEARMEVVARRLAGDEFNDEGDRSGDDGSLSASSRTREGNHGDEGQNLLSDDDDAEGIGELTDEVVGDGTEDDEGGYGGLADDPIGEETPEDGRSNPVDEGRTQQGRSSNGTSTPTRSPRAPPSTSRRSQPQDGLLRDGAGGPTLEGHGATAGQTIGTIKTDIEKEIMTRVERELSRRLQAQAQKQAANQKRQATLITELQDQVHDLRRQLQDQAQLQDQVQQLHDQVEQLQDQVKEMERSRVQDADNASRRPPRPRAPGAHPHSTRSQTGPGSDTRLPPRRSHASSSSSGDRRGSGDSSSPHRQQLFIRTEIPLPEWALADNGARATEILRRVGIRLPAGATSQLHRGGLTNAFILCFRSHHDAWLVLEQALNRRLFQPGNPVSIKVQWKRAPRPPRPSRGQQEFPRFVRNASSYHGDRRETGSRRHSGHQSNLSAGHYGPRNPVDNRHSPARHAPTETRTPRPRQPRQQPASRRTPHTPCMDQASSSQAAWSSTPAAQTSQAPSSRATRSSTPGAPTSQAKKQSRSPRTSAHKSPKPQPKTKPPPARKPGRQSS